MKPPSDDIRRSLRATKGNMALTVAFLEWRSAVITRSEGGLTHFHLSGTQVAGFRTQTAMPILPEWLMLKTQSLAMA